MSCGVGHRLGSDPELLWLCCRPVAKTPIRPLVWELTYVAGVTLKRKGKKKKERERERNKQQRTKHAPCFLINICFDLII